jgi:hypothetical protein
MKTAQLLPIACAVFGSATGAFAQNFLLNPSFENPVVPAGSYISYSTGQGVGAGWVVGFAFYDAAVVDVGYTGGGVVWAPPTDGSQYLYVGDSASASTVYQDVALSPGSYRLTFDLANFLAGDSGNGAKVSLSVDQLPGGTVASGSFQRPTSAGYAPQELDFVLGSGGTYRVGVTSADGFGSNVDNFSLVKVAVPEPGAWGILGGSASLVFAVARRRMRRAL